MVLVAHDLPTSTTNVQEFSTDLSIVCTTARRAPSVSPPSSTVLNVEAPSSTVSDTMLIGINDLKADVLLGNQKASDANNNFQHILEKTKACMGGVYQQKKESLLVRESFAEIAICQKLLKQLQDSQPPKFLPRMAPAYFRDVLQQISTICDLCYDLGAKEACVPFFQFAQTLCTKGGIPIIDVASIFRSEVTKDASVPMFGGAQGEIIDETDRVFVTLTKLIDCMKNECTAKDILLR